MTRSACQMQRPHAIILHITHRGTASRWPTRPSTCMRINLRALPYLGLVHTDSRCNQGQGYFRVPSHARDCEGRVSRKLRAVTRGTQMLTTTWKAWPSTSCRNGGNSRALRRTWRVEVAAPQRRSRGPTCGRTAAGGNVAGKYLKPWSRANKDQ